MRTKSEHSLGHPPAFDLSRRLQTIEFPDLREITLAPKTFDISAQAEKKVGLLEELAEVQAAAPTRSPVWLAEYVEKKFDLRALRRGLRMAKPESNCLPWDRMVIGKLNWYRVQIKYTTVADHNVFKVYVKKSQNRPYNAGEFDFLAVLTPAPEYEPEETEAWYIMPFEAIATARWISFPRLRSQRRYAATEYRERWDLFA
jgi:hypothetical protein